jgi:hypothetical protein
MINLSNFEKSHGKRFFCDIKKIKHEKTNSN